MQEASLGQDGRLRDEFARWRQEPFNRFPVRLRRHRAGQLRQLLADPDRVAPAAFNRDVWPLESDTVLRPEGTHLKLTSETLPDPSLIPRVDAALDAGELELHGNYVWWPASGIYDPHLKDDAQKLENLQFALLIRNDPALSPLEGRAAPGRPRVRRQLGDGPRDGLRPRRLRDP
jgi:hypothetical protein